MIDDLVNNLIQEQKKALSKFDDLVAQMPEDQRDEFVNFKREITEKQRNQDTAGLEKLMKQFAAKWQG